jgi:hypothetical protein
MRVGRLWERSLLEAVMLVFYDDTWSPPDRQRRTCLDRVREPPDMVMGWTPPDGIDVPKWSC